MGKSADTYDQKRERVLEAARSLLREKGFRDFTMRNIAKRAGLAKATLYYYFGGRQDVLREIVQREGAKVWEKINQAIAQASNPVEKLRAFAIARFQALTEVFIYYRTLTEDYLRHYDFIEQERETYTRLELQTIEMILREGMARGIFNVKDPRLAAFAIAMAIKGLEYPLVVAKGVNIDGRHLGLEQAIDMMLELLLKGIETRSAPESDTA